MATLLRAEPPPRCDDRKAVADAVMSAAWDCAASYPVAVLLAWERPDGAVEYRSVPCSEASYRGMLALLNAHGLEHA